MPLKKWIVFGCSHSFSHGGKNGVDQEWCVEGKVERDGGGEEMRESREVRESNKSEGVREAEGKRR